MAGEIPGLNIQVTIDSSGVTAGVQSVTNGLKTMEDSVKATSSTFSGFKSIMTGVFAGNLLTTGLMDAQKGFSDLIANVEAAQNTLVTLSTAMNNAQVNTEANRTTVDKTAESMKNLGFTTASTQQAYTTLITATGSVTESTSMMSMAADLARYKHESLAEAATTLARGTQGSVKAFKELGITLDTSLPKNEAIAKAFDQLNEKIGGQANAYLGTFTGQLEVMKTKFEDATTSVGQALLPALTDLLKIIMTVAETMGSFISDVLSPMIKYFEDNKTAVEAFLIVVGGAVAIWGVYEAAVKAAELAQAAFNLVLDANPITLLVAAVALLAAGIVIAWNDIKPLRDALVDVAVVGVQGFGDLVHVFGDVVTAIMNLVTGPMKLLLDAMSHLPIVGKGAKDALNDINGATKDVGTFFDSTANSIKNMGASLESLKNSKISLPDILGNGQKTLANAGTTSAGGSTGVGGDIAGGNVGGSASKAAAAAAKKDLTQLTADSKQVNTIYNDMTTALKDYNASYLKLVDTKNKADAAAQDTFQKASIAANDTYNKAMSSAQETYDATALKAQQTYSDSVAKIDDTFQTDSLNALNTYNDTVQKATDANNAAVLKLNTDAADKQLALVQKSEAELTDAFQKATTVDLASSFTGTGTATGLVSSLQDQLNQMNKLAADAAQLGGLGYSQQFIQQVVAQGPLLGDQMAQALINAQPGTTAQIQNLFSQVQDVSANGLNGLAASLNQNGVLADTTLQAQYNQVGTNLQTALAAQQSTFNDALTAATTTYNDAITKATQAQTDAIAAAQATLDQTLSDATTKLTDAQTAAKTALNDSLTAANKALTDSLTASQTTFDQATTALHDSTMTKLNDLQTKLEGVAKLMSSLGVAGSASATLALNGSIAAPYTTGYSALPTPTTTTTATPSVTVNQTNNIDGTTAPSDITSATINGILYGTTQGLISLPTLQGIV